MSAKHAMSEFGRAVCAKQTLAKLSKHAAYVSHAIHFQMTRGKILREKPPYVTFPQISTTVAFPEVVPVLLADLLGGKYFTVYKLLSVHARPLR